MTKKKAACVRMDHDVYEALKQAADSADRSVESQIRLLIHQHLRKLGKMPREQKQ